MRKNFNKRFLGILFFFIPLLVMSFPSTYAEEANVLDCLENEADCEEEGVDIEEDEPATSAEEIVGSETFNASSLFFNIVKMVVALFFILALIYIIVLVLRRRNNFLQQQDIIKNLGGIGLGQNKSIQLIRIGSRIYVVGVGEHVDLMFEITDEEVLEALLTKEMDEVETPFLQQFFKKDDSKDASATPFMQQLKDELTKLQENRTKLVNKSVEKDDEHE